MSTETKTQGVTVRKEVKVKASQSHAFEVFTQEIASWWPLESHHIGALPAQSASIEPRKGGRWFERASDGSECDWGRVLVWEPPNRIVLSWDISSQWKHDPDLGTEVEVRFIPESADTTRVELEHRLLERYGANTEIMRATFESEGGWAGLLRGFAAQASTKR